MARRELPVQFYLIPLAHAPGTLVQLFDLYRNRPLTPGERSTLNDQFMRCLHVAGALITYAVALAGRPCIN